MRKNEKVGKTTTRRKQKAVISKSKRNKRDWKENFSQKDLCGYI